MPVIQSYDAEELSDKLTDLWVQKKLVEVVFESKLDIVKKLSLDQIIKLMRVYLTAYLEFTSTSGVNVDDYNRSFLESSDITDSESWYKSVVEIAREAPENKVIDGIVYSANLYIMEKILKNKYKKSLWLT